MKAFIYDGAGKTKVVDKPAPKIENAADAIIKMVRTTICGTDLHIIKGDVPTVEQGRTLGHEGIGIVTEVGSEVKHFKKDDRVLIACITGCATCNFCRRNDRGNCNGGGGWLLGHLIDGTQQEYLRMPFADANLYRIPKSLDERSLLVASDMLPTGLEVATLRGHVTPGCTVAIVGAGPVGIASGLCAQLYAPKQLVYFDMDDFRLSQAKKIGATHVYNVSGDADVRQMAKAHFGELDGFDVVIEAVGTPKAFLTCAELVGKGGHIANVGVHGAPVNLPIERLWIRTTTISMALVSAHTIPMLLDLLEAGKLDTSPMITHDFKFSEIEKAYDVFGKAADNQALKVSIEFA